jgi:hypothetical protein
VLLHGSLSGKVKLMREPLYQKRPNWAENRVRKVGCMLQAVKEKDGGPQTADRGFCSLISIQQTRVRIVLKREDVRKVLEIGSSGGLPSAVLGILRAHHTP